MRAASMEGDIVALVTNKGGGCMNQDTDSLNDIQRELFRLQDANYRNLQIKLIPAVLPDTIIGVKTPVL